MVFLLVRRHPVSMLTRTDRIIRGGSICRRFCTSQFQLWFPWPISSFSTGLWWICRGWIIFIFSGSKRLQRKTVYANIFRVCSLNHFNKCVRVIACGSDFQTTYFLPRLIFSTDYHFMNYNDLDRSKKISQKCLLNHWFKCCLIWFQEKLFTYCNASWNNVSNVTEKQERRK